MGLRVDQWVMASYLAGWLTRWMGDDWRMDGYTGRWMYDGKQLVGWWMSEWLDDGQVTETCIKNNVGDLREWTDPHKHGRQASHFRQTWGPAQHPPGRRTEGKCNEGTK